MTQPSPFRPQFDHLATAISTLDDEARYALRLALEPFAPITPPETRPDRVGAWDIVRDASGRVDWRVRPDLSLRERYSWRAVPLSSERPPGIVRLVLLGSSAAASFGYWQDFTLASALERKLNAASGEKRFEVIDLTCINALWSDAIQTLQMAASLQPDIAIFYCGNNESKSLMRRLEAGQMADLPSVMPATFPEALDMPDWSGALHRCLEELVEKLVTRSAATARSLGMDVAIVVPQYNLKDWQGPERMPVDLPSAALEPWWEAVTGGEALLDEGKGSEALALFDQALALDRGQCQRSLFGRARALSSTGASDSQRNTAFVAARDAGIAPFVGAIPQVTQGAIERIRQTCGALGVPVADLPDLLEQAADGAPPDRSFFLDYCHLGAGAIDLLAAELTGIVLNRTSAGSRVPVPFPSLAAEPVRPAAEEEGLACWVAAIHNYHYGQSLEVVRHWLALSLETWPPIARLCRFLSANLCSPWRERFTLEWFRRDGLYDLLGEQYFFFFAKFFYHARFDHALVRLIDDLLGNNDDPSWDERLSGTLRDLDGQLYSLFFMDMRRGLVSGDRTAPRGGWERPCLDFDASEPESVIEFPADGGAAKLILELSAPPGAGGTCIVRINGQEVLGCDVSTAWHRHEAPIPAGFLVNGLNRLSLRWTRLSGLSEVTSTSSRRRFISRHGFYPVAARIHKFQIIETAGVSGDA